MKGGVLKKELRLTWRTDEQRRISRQFLAACRAQGRNREFVIEELMTNYLRKHGRLDLEEATHES